MGGLPFDVGFIGEDIGIVGPAFIRQVTNGPDGSACLIGGKMHQYGGFDRIDVVSDIDPAPEFQSFVDGFHYSCELAGQLFSSNHLKV